MKYAEFHCHTVYSNQPGKNIESLTSVEKLLETAKKRGLSAVAITDHDTMTGSVFAQSIANQYGLVIIPAEEISANGKGQVFGYGISREIKPLRNTVEIIRDIHNAGGLAVIPHPFDIKRGMEDLEKIIGEADGIEILNHGATGNNKAKDFAGRLNIKIRTGGSDAHTWRTIGAVRMGFPDTCVNAQDYLTCLKLGDCVIKIGLGYYRSMFWGAVNLLEMRTISAFKRKRNKAL